MKTPLFVQGMQGLGDSFMQRPYIRLLVERGEQVVLATSWPQLFADLGVSKFLDPHTLLRTQRKNLARSETKTLLGGGPMPARFAQITLHYTAKGLMRGSVFDELEQTIPVGANETIRFDGPRFLPNSLTWFDLPPYAIVRPPTIRKEWASSSRNCLPEYIDLAAKHLESLGFIVISLADLKDGEEALVGAAPFAHLRLHNGELPIESLVEAIAHAAVVVSPVGWALPMSIAYRTKCVIVAGGRGAHNAPWKLTDPRQPLSNLRWVMPDHYCMCESGAHDCNKRITDFENKFALAFRSLRIQAPYSVISKEQRAAGVLEALGAAHLDRSARLIDLENLLHRR